MKKEVIIYSLIAVSIIFSLLNVKAESYYINSNNVEMTKQQYNRIVNHFSENIASTISQEKFDKIINANMVDYDVIYQKIKSNKDGIILTEYISEEEYNASPDAEYTCKEEYLENTKSDDYGYIETTYKRFEVELLDFGNNDFVLLAYLTWKRVPACRSYDVFAFRLNHMTYSNVGGIQTYYIGTAHTDISYDSSSPGYKSATNGAGFSMNLKDGTTITKYEMVLMADLAINEFNYSTAHVYTTYQHAISSLSRADSMSYTFSAGGLGGVLLYSSTNISQKYDDMAGIHLSTPIS